jgi:hypothetical protein
VFSWGHGEGRIENCLMSTEFQLRKMKYLMMVKSNLKMVNYVRYLS